MPNRNLDEKVAKIIVRDDPGNPFSSRLGVILKDGRRFTVDCGPIRLNDASEADLQHIRTLIQTQIDTLDSPHKRKFA